MIVLCKIEFCLMHCCSCLKILNQNLKLKFHQVDFWFEFFDIHMNEKEISCHDCHGFKWQYINIYPILIVFLCNPMPFFGSLDCDYTKRGWILTHFSFIFNMQQPFLSFHVTLQMPQKRVNLVKEWRRYELLHVRGFMFNCRAIKIV